MKRIDRVLRQSMSDATPVAIRRSVERHETQQGVVLALSDEWALFANLNDAVILDGYDVVRRAEIIRAWHKPLFADYLARHNVWPPTAPPGIDLTDTRTVIESTSVSTVASIACEEKHPQRLLIGFVAQWRKKSLWLRTIDTDCQWEDFDVKLRLKDITQVSFGSAYERAVLEVAGPFKSPNSEGAVPAGA
jgi:hypothetical protein